MLGMFCLAIYINEVPLFGDPRNVNTGTYIEYFLFFPLFYSSVHWLEEVGLYQTLMFSMVFQCLSVLVSKTANDSAGIHVEEVVGEVLSSVAQVYLFNGITKFTGTWFDNRSRYVATACIILSAHIANYTPMWIMLWYLNKPLNQQIDMDIFEVMDRFRLVLFILNVFLSLAIIMFF